MNLTINKLCDKKRASRFMFISFVVIIVLWGFSFTELMSPGFWQALSVVYFGGATFYGVKFYLTEYTYTLTSDDFVIVKTVGNKSVKVCHVDNSTIVNIYSKEEWKEQKNNRQITSVYNYNASASPDEFYVLVFDIDGKYTAVMFEGSREMKKAIDEVILGLKESQENR